MKEIIDGLPPRRLTMEALAQLVGVNKSTVSRAMRPGTTFYRSDTAQRIRAIAESMNFQMDRNAASLRTQRTGTIGVLVPRLSDNLQAVFYESVVNACMARDIVALVAVTGDDVEAERRAGSALLGRRVDGLILTSTRVHGQFPAQLEDRKVPFVLAIRQDGEGRASVVGEDRKGGYLVTRHLIELGHRRIAMIAGPDHASTALDRRVGYVEAHHEAGLPVDKRFVLKSMFRWQDGYEIALRLLASDDPPTAIFAVNDETAFGVVAAARTSGFDLPRQLSIVGYDDIPSASHPPLPLTTARMDIATLAERAVDLLCARIDGRPAESGTIPVSLIVRESTAPPEPHQSR